MYNNDYQMKLMRFSYSSATWLAPRALKANKQMTYMCNRENRIKYQNAEKFVQFCHLVGTKWENKYMYYIYNNIYSTEVKHGEFSCQFCPIFRVYSQVVYSSLTSTVSPAILARLFRSVLSVAHHWCLCLTDSLPWLSETSTLAFPSHFVIL